MSGLEMKKVGEGEFKKDLDSLDDKGKLPFELAIGNEHAIFYEGDKKIGFASYTKDDLTESHILDGLAIHQDYRDKGYGREIIQHLIEDARKEGKYLRVCSLPSEVEFYLKCGLTLAKNNDLEPEIRWLVGR